MDGKFEIVTSGWSCQLNFWNPRLCKLKKTENLSQEAQVYDILVHPQSKDFYTARLDGTIVRHKRGEGEMSKSGILEGHTGGVKCISQISSRMFLSGSFDSTLRLWDNMFDKMVAVIRGHSGWVNGCATLSQDIFFSVSEDRTLREWALSQGKATRMVKNNLSLTSISVIPGQSLVLTGSETAVLWSAKTLGKVLELKSQKVSRAAVTSLHHQYPYVFLGTDDGNLFCYDCRRSITDIWRSRVHESDITNILSYKESSTNKNYLLTSSYDGWVYYHDLQKILNNTNNPSTSSSSNFHPCKGMREKNGITMLHRVPEVEVVAAKVVKNFPPLPKLIQPHENRSNPSIIKKKLPTIKKRPLSTSILDVHSNRRSNIEPKKKTEASSVVSYNQQLQVENIQNRDYNNSPLVKSAPPKVHITKPLPPAPQTMNVKNKKKKQESKRPSSFALKKRKSWNKKSSKKKGGNPFKKILPKPKKILGIKSSDENRKNEGFTIDQFVEFMNTSPQYEKEKENEQSSTNVELPQKKKVNPRSSAKVSPLSFEDFQDYQPLGDIHDQSPRRVSEDPSIFSTSQKKNNNNVNNDVEQMSKFFSGTGSKSVTGRPLSFVRSPSMALPGSPSSPSTAEVEKSFYFLGRDEILQHDIQRFIHRYIQFRAISNHLREDFTNERYFETIQVGTSSSSESEVILPSYESMLKTCKELKETRSKMIGTLKRLPPSKHEDKKYQDLFKQVVNSRYLKFYAKEYIFQKSPLPIAIRVKKKKKKRILSFFGKYSEDGLRNGLGVEFWESTSGKVLKFRGNYSQNQRAGQGCEYNSKGVRIFQGLYSNDTRNGMGICYSGSDGKEKYRANWRDGRIFKYDTNSIDLKDIIIKNFDSLIADKIHYRDRIGSGSFGDVFRCQLGGKMYAVKLLNPPSSVSERKEYIETLERTIKLCKSLHHPNILEILGYSGAKEGSGEKGQSKTMGYLMPLCRESLLDRIIRANQQQQQQQHTLSSSSTENKICAESFGWKMLLEEKMRILVQVCDGMKYLHSNHVMHRDLKLENLLLNDEGIVKIIDFDFAKVDESSFRKSYDNSAERLGSLYFMATEVFRRKNYTKECDIFSFGIVLYCMMFEREIPYEYDTKNDVYKLTCEECKIRPPKKTRKENKTRTTDELSFFSFSEEEEEEEEEEIMEGIPRIELINHVVRCDLRPLIPPSVTSFLKEKTDMSSLTFENDDSFFSSIRREKPLHTRKRSLMEEKERDEFRGKMKEIVNLMRQCWDKNPKKRPKFEEILYIFRNKFMKS